MTSTLLRHRPRVLTVVACGVGLVLAVSGCDSTQDARQAVSDAASDARARLDKALDAARAGGWTVVDMKADWRTIFPAWPPR